MPMRRHLNTATIAQCRLARDTFRRFNGKLLRTFTDKRVGYYRINTLLPPRQAQKLIKTYALFGIVASRRMQPRAAPFVSDRASVVVYVKANVEPPRRADKAARKRDERKRRAAQEGKP